MTDLEYLEIKNKINSQVELNLTEDELDNLWLQCIEYNKQLIKRFPFLFPKNVWTGSQIIDFDYSWTLLDEVSEGWRKAFGIQMCQEILDSLSEEEKDNYNVIEIKEKFGTLRWYDNSISEAVNNIVYKYWKLSEDTCEYCGKPAKYTTEGWITNLCEDCFMKELNIYPTEKRDELLKTCNKEYKGEEIQ